MNSVHIDLTAYHEAAHAIVGLCQERDVKLVLVSIENPGAGLCSYYPRKPNPSIKVSPGNVNAKWLGVLKDYKATIRTCLAGPLAEAKVMRTPLRSLGARSDLTTAEQYFIRLREIYGELSRHAKLEEKVPDDLLDKLRAQTRAFIARPKVWRMIDHVAIELIWTKSITGTDIARVIQQLQDLNGQSGFEKMFD